MALPSISDMITAEWPTTEAKLSASEDFRYLTQKSNAIERAKVELYGTLPVPAAESNIPAVACIWIADKALASLIPLAIDWYMQQRVTETKRETTYSYTNRAAVLADLLDRVNGRLQSNEAAALEAISAVSTRKDEDPVVSTAGLVVDPIGRAMQRGPLPY